MKQKTIFLFMILSFSLNLSGQIINNSISKIEKQVLKINQDSTLKSYKVSESEIIKVKKYNEDENIHVLKKKNKIAKIEYYSKQGSDGAYTSMKIYLRHNKPILIEKETKEIITARLTKGGIKIFEKFTKSKTFILDWTENKFEYMYWNKETNKYESQKGDIFDVMFKGEKFDIIRILKLSETAIIEVSK